MCEREEEDRERRRGRVCVVREIEGEYVLREKRRKRVCDRERTGEWIAREGEEVCVFAYGRGWIYIYIYIQTSGVIRKTQY